jgi:C_GCAxxG_C_C family probable redox protein
MMSVKSDLAAEMFSQGYNCAQSVFGSCVGEAMPRDLAVRIAQAFGGGVGRTGNLCGALTGALMALGLHYVPRADAAAGGAVLPLTDGAAKAQVYKKAKALMDEFARRNGSLMCRDLVGCDLMTPEGQRKFKETDAHNKICMGLVRSAVEILEIG